MACTIAARAVRLRRLDGVSVSESVGGIRHGLGMSHAATVLTTSLTTVLTTSLTTWRDPASPTDETERLADYGLALAELESCTGLVLLHADGSTECVEAVRCPADPVLHAGAVRCGEAGLDCC